MADPKKFDAVTIVGLALAIAIIWWGYNQSQQRALEERKRMEAAAAEEARLQPIKKDGASVPIPNSNGKGTDPVKPVPVEDPEPELAEVPDVTLAGEKLELVFSARGATLKKARLLGVAEDPAKRDKNGLDILGEIEPGRRAFGIPNFNLEADGKSILKLDGKEGKALDRRVWELKDAGAFDANGSRTVVYAITVKNVALVKTFTFNKKDYFAKCDLKIENKTDQDGTLYYWLNGPQGIVLDSPRNDPNGEAAKRVQVQAEMAGRVAGQNGPNTDAPDVIQVYAPSAIGDDDKSRSVSNQENLWGAVKNRFHMASFISLEPRQLIKIVAFKMQVTEVVEDKRLNEPNIGIVGYRKTIALRKSTSQNDPYAIYLGPADDRYIEAAETELKTSAPYHQKMAIQFFDMGSWRWPRVDWLARQMMWLFQGLYKVFGNFGVALVILTILIKLAMHPLQRKMMVSMQKMQKLQPDMEKIKAKYKTQPQSWETQQKMNSELRDLTMKHGASPVSGCLPMLIQIPVLSALYGIFSHAYDMRGAGFLWIKDLSEADHLAQLGFWPHWLNLLPLLYIALSYLQTHMTPQTKSADPNQDMQRKMMMFMPVMIGLMWYSFMPAGLMLYFVVSASWGMAENWYIRKIVLHDPNAPAPANAI